MQRRRDLTKKLIASLIVFMLAFSNFATLGNALVVYAAEENQDPINFSAQFVMITNNEEENNESNQPEPTNPTEQESENQEQSTSPENPEQNVELEGQVESNSENTQSVMGSMGSSFEAYEANKTGEEGTEQVGEENVVSEPIPEDNSIEESEGSENQEQPESTENEGEPEIPEEVSETENIPEEEVPEQPEEPEVKKEQVLENGLAIEITVGVKDTGYLKNARIDIKDLANQSFKLKDNISFGEYIQSIEDNKIKLKQINSGTEVKVYIPIELKKEEYVNIEKLQGGVDLVLTTTYVDNEGIEEILTKSAKPVLLLSNDMNLVVGSEIEKFIPYTRDGVNEALVQIKVIVGTDTDNDLPIKDTTTRLVIPQIEGAQIAELNVSAISTGYTNGLTNGEAIFTTENWNYSDGAVNIAVDNTQKDGMYKRNSGNDEYIVSYKYTNIGDISSEKIKSTVEVKSNVFTSEGTKEISNQIEKEYDLSQANSNIITYDLTRKTGEVSKGYLYGNVNAVEQAEYEVEYDNTLDVNISRVDLVKIIEIRESDEYFTDGEGNRYSAEGNTYYKSVRVNKENLLSIIGETGNLELLLEDGTSLIQVNKDTEAESDGNITISFGENKIGKILIRINNPVSEGILNILCVKAIEKATYGKIDMASFNSLVSEYIAGAELIEGIITDIGSKYVATELTNTITDPSVRVSRSDLSTLVENEDVEIELNLNNATPKSDMYKNPVFELTFPEQVEDVEIKDMNLLYGNDELEIGNIETLRNEQNQVVIKLTLNGTQTKYVTGESEKGTTIILKTDIKVNMYTASRSSKIEVNYYNEDATNYGLGTDWKMITEPSSYMLTARQGIYETELNIVAPEGLVNAQMISNYKDGASIISVNQGMKEDSIATFKDARNAEMKMLVINNSKEDMKNVSILGRAIFNGNKKITEDVVLGANTDAPMISGIKEETSGFTTKIYYSENGEATKDLEKAENGWTESVEDFRKVKSFLIVVDEDVKVGDILTYSYEFEIPAKLTNNIDLAGTFATYYTGEKSDSVEEADKILLSTGDAPVLTTKIVSDCDNATVVPGQRIKYTVKVTNEGRTTSENVAVNQLIPDGTIYVNENGELEPDTHEIKLELGKIAPSRTAEATYEVEVDGSTSVSSEISTSTNVEADGLEEPIYVEPDKLLLENAELSISLHQIDEGRIVKQGDELWYDINLINYLNSPIKDCVIEMILPDNLEYLDAYVIGFEEDGLTEKADKKAMYDSAARSVRWNLDYLSTFQTLKLKVRTTNIMEDRKDISLVAKISSDNIKRTYVSNEIKHTIARPILDCNYYSNIENRYIKEGDYISYILDITNIGVIEAQNIDISNVIPEGMKVTGATVIKNGISNTALVGKNINFTINLGPNEEAKIVLECNAQNLDDTTEERISSSSWNIRGENISSINTQAIENIIQQNPELTNNSNSSKKNEDDLPDIKVENNIIDKSEIKIDSRELEQTSEYKENNYRIIGKAFNDKNKNGQRDDSEAGMENIVAKLCDASSQKIVNQTVTNASGEYVFENVIPGEYYVKFEYDSSKYQVSDYKKDGVIPDRNSDVVVSNYKAITDKIEIVNTSISDIDIGLYRAGIFDMSIDANINKVTVQNEDETNTYEMENSKLAKVDINPKYADSSKIFVEYTIDVSNKGEIAGYVKSIVDYLPEGLELDTSLNANWYIGNDGNAYTRELENVLIQPGETKKITLILTKQMTSEGTGVINNTFEIAQSYNEYAIADIDSVEGNKADGEDDMSNANIIIGIQTGGSMINVMLITTTLITLLVVLFVLKQRIDNKNKEVIV